MSTLYQSESNYKHDFYQYFYYYLPFRPFLGEHNPAKNIYLFHKIWEQYNNTYILTQSYIVGWTLYQFSSLQAKILSRKHWDVGGNLGPLQAHIWPLKHFHAAQFTQAYIEELRRYNDFFSVIIKMRLGLEYFFGSSQCQSRLLPLPIKNGLALGHLKTFSSSRASPSVNRANPPPHTHTHSEGRSLVRSGPCPINKDINSTWHELSKLLFWTQHL